jgi:probable DNA metabolism protein
MTTLVYDGSFTGWLTAVFEVFEYKFADAGIQPEHRYQEELLHQKHVVITSEEKSSRVWKKLGDIISRSALRQLYQTFLSEENNMENMLLNYVRYVLTTPVSVEHDFSNSYVLYVQQTSRKVHREKHRMEAFVRFQLTRDKLYYAIVQPDFNVLPLLHAHFKDRYADQRWLIYDTQRRYGIYYDLLSVTEVKIDFSNDKIATPEHTGEMSEDTIATPDDTAATPDKRAATPDSVYDEKESLYQQLWQQYFSSVNIKARKNTKLHIQHMPRRYWKYLTEKKI